MVTGVRSGSNQFPMDKIKPHPTYVPEKPVHVVLKRLNVLQLKKTHANSKNTSKLSKHLHQFDNICAANTQNATKYRHTVQILTTYIRLEC